MIVESVMFVAGAAIYATATRARDRIGAIAYWAMVAVLGGLYVASALGPPPPSVAAIEISAFVGYLFVPWASWIDRHRMIQA